MSTKRKSSAVAALEKIAGKKLTLGSLLRAIRLGEELTQTEFGIRLGLSKQHVSDIEHSRRFVSPKMARKFAKQLGYNPEQFIRLCLQDELDRYNIPYVVHVEAA